MIGRALALGLAASVLIAACGGPVTNPGPSSRTTAQPSATLPPQASESGRPAGWDADGKVTFEVTGIPNPFTDSLGYSPSRSYFGGDAQSFLSFSNDGSDDTLIVQVTDGNLVIQYAGATISIPSAECEAPILKLDAALSSGTFDCGAPTATNSDGQTFAGARISGSFEAHG